MAARYWVGGTASWDATAGTKWALTSGGAGGQAVPTSADDVFFDAASGAVTCTLASGNTGSKALNFTGFTGTFTGSLNFQIFGSLTISSGMTYTHTGTMNFNATATITTAGKTLGPVTVGGSGITVDLGDALTSSGAITLTQGTFTTNNFNVTATSLSSSNSNTRTINLGSSTVTLSSTSAVVFTTNTNLTFNAGTSTIICTANATLQAGTTSGQGVTFYNVSFTSTTAGLCTVQAINTFNNLLVTAPASAGVQVCRFDSRQTINGTLSTSGTAGNRRVWFYSQTYGIAHTLTINSAPSLTDADFRDIYVIGTAAPISGTRIGDLRGIRGITASAPKTVYWNLAGAQNWSANGWATTSTGTPSTDNFPLAQDIATFTNAGSVTGTITMDAAVLYTGTVDMFGRTSAMTLLIGTTAIYGDWKNGSGTTLSGGSTLTFSGRNIQTITSSGKNFTGSIIVDTYGGAVELADAINVGNGTGVLTVTNGTLDTKNFSVTAGSLSSSNSNVRTINLGSSTVTLSGGSPIDFSSVNITFNAGTSNIICSSATIAFTGAFQTFYDVSFTGGAGVKQLNSTATYRNLSVSAPASAAITTLVALADQTITGTLTVAGATAVRRVFVRSSVLGTTRTLTVNSLSAQDCDFRDITIAGAAAGSSPTRAGDCGGNTGITFPAAKTVYWALTGGGAWTSTNVWATSIGGAGDINNFPLAQDTAVFPTGYPTTGNQITLYDAMNHGGINTSAKTTETITLNNTGTAQTFYGDILFGSGTTLTGNPYTLAKRGTQTITSSGVIFNQNITIDSFSGTVQLADALTIIAARTLTLTSGTFDAVTYNVTTGLFSFGGGAVQTLKMGSGTWTLSGTGTMWSLNGTTNVSFYKGTADIVLSSTSTSTRTFTGGGASYNKLTIGGTTGTSTTNLEGTGNQFTELASTKTVAHTIALGTTTQTFGAWTVTGTAGNVVTLTGTGTSHILAGACTSGIDYLAMGSIGFAATSPGEFYAGANSTATAAAAPLYLTAKPADSTRYWVGGTGTWSDTARWSDTSGGAGGKSVPRSHDDVVFNSASNATAYTATVNAVTGGIRTKALTIAGPASGNVTLAGSTAIDGIHGNVTLPATGLTRTYTGAITLSGSATGRTLTTNGVALASATTVNGVSSEWALGSALNNGTSNITVTNGNLLLSNYNLTAGAISSNNSNSRTINFGSGTISLSGSGQISFGTTETTAANLTVTASTSQINLSSVGGTFQGNGKTFYNVTCTDNNPFLQGIDGTNTFNNLSFTGITAVGLKNISLTANQTINGTLTLSAGTNAAMRTFVRSDTIGTTRTLTCAAFSSTDADFRDITIAGAAAPVSGTRLGDCKGNSGITFGAGVTRYWNLVGGGNWSATGWAATSGGSPAANNFPLAQDTCLFEATGLNSGATVTVDAAYNIGTIDMSARTSNTMTLTMGSTTPTIYGNWINGTGTTITPSSGILTFSGRGSQTITGAGVDLSIAVTVDSPGGSVTLQDALTVNRSSNSAFTLTRGTFDANNYNFSLTGSLSGFSSNNSNIRTVTVGSGTWTIAGTGGWTVGAGTNITVTGTGTISFTSASAKTFAGGGISYSGITLNQGNAGTLTITGNNTFKDISNTYKATGATTIAMGTTTQTVGTFTASGEVGRVLTVQGTSASSPATLVFSGLVKPNVDYLAITGVRAYSLIDTWYAGANSINNGSLGWYFQSGVAAIAGGLFFLLF